jgi:hypothetical protein
LIFKRAISKDWSALEDDIRTFLLGADVRSPKTGLAGRLDFGTSTGVFFQRGEPIGMYDE